MRLKSTHEIVTMYEDTMAEVPSVTSARSATAEPILMRERRMVTTRLIQMALRGIFQPGLT
jgi:hypothetical protein